MFDRINSRQGVARSYNIQREELP